MKTRNWNLYPYAKLIHLNRERNEKNVKRQNIQPSIISTIKTDVIEKYRILKFDDVRRFFKSLSLEEEKEFSVLLSNFYNSKSILRSDISDEIVAHLVNKNTKLQEIESLELETLFLKLKKQAEESEIMLQNLMAQQEERQVMQNEDSEDDSNKAKVIADNILDQLSEHLKLENMRRGQ